MGSIAGVLRVFAAYIAAVIAMAIIGVAAQSLFVVLGLMDVGARIGLGDAASMAFADIAGLGPLYGGFIAIGFAIAFLAAAAVARLMPVPRRLVFAVAGCVCMLVMLMAMREVFFGVQVIAGARSLPGLLTQTILGFAAGWIFAAFTPPPSGRRSASDMSL